METKMQNYCKVYAFFKATRGNWRNAIYISCDQHACPYGYKPACTGYLMTANENGQPIIISEIDYMQITGEPIDPTECQGKLTRQAFMCLYAQFMHWHIGSVQDCPLRILGLQTADCCN